MCVGVNIASDYYNIVYLGLDCVAFYFSLSDAVPS